MSAVVAFNGKIVYYDDAIVTYDLATAIASVDPDPGRTITATDNRTLSVASEARTLVVS